MQDHSWVDESCGDCRYSVKFKRPPQPILSQAPLPDLLECRKNPPTVVALPQSTPQGMSVGLRSDYPKVTNEFSACACFQKVQETSVKKSTVSDARLDVTKFPKTLTLPEDDGKNEES